MSSMFTQEDKNKILQVVEHNLDRMMDALDTFCPEGKESEIQDFLNSSGYPDVSERWRDYVSGF